MLKASDFVLVGFEATVVGFNLTASRSKLAAQLLDRYGEQIDEIRDFGFTRRRQSDWDEFQLGFGNLGFLTVRNVLAKVACGFPDEAGPGTVWVTGRMNWAVDLLSTILEFHKQDASALWLEMTWLLFGESSTTRLIEHMGLTRALNGFFAASQEFEIRGDTHTDVPGLFAVDCELTAGRLGDYEPPEDIGVQLEYRSPDNRVREGPRVDYSRPMLDKFFGTAPHAMSQHLARLFPVGETP